jgi:hypothetical protein
MEPLIKNQFFLDKNWLMDISPELAELPRELKYKDEKDKEIAVNSTQINIIIFDWFCRQFFAHKEDQSIDAKLLSELWGGDAKGSYRILDKLYFVYGKMHCFQEESINIAKDKGDHRWFIHKVQFPKENFKEEFTSRPYPKHMSSSGNLDLEFTKKMIREEVFQDIYPDYLHKSIADFFFK